jgi:hypothetical protein
MLLMLSVTHDPFMLSVVMLDVVMLSVVAAFYEVNCRTLTQESKIKVKLLALH